MTYLIWGGGALICALGLLFMRVRAARKIARQATADGKQVIRIRPKLVRPLFISGLTPLAMIYRVTTTTEDSKAQVRLYAYDPGMWFSRTDRSLRQYSGGVWRNAA